MSLSQKMLSARELAEFLGVHENYVYDQAVNGDLPSYKFGGCRRFRWVEVEEWLSRHKRQARNLAASFGASLAAMRGLGHTPLVDVSQLAESLARFVPFV